MLNNQVGMKHGKGKSIVSSTSFWLVMKMDFAKQPEKYI